MSGKTVPIKAQIRNTVFLNSILASSVILRPFESIASSTSSLSATGINLSDSPSKMASRKRPRGSSQSSSNSCDQVTSETPTNGLYNEMESIQIDNNDSAASSSSYDMGCHKIGTTSEANILGDEYSIKYTSRPVSFTLN